MIRSDRAPRTPRAAPFVALAAFLLVGACASAPPNPLREDEPRAVLDRFSAAVDAGRWDEAFPLLSARWRARETPSRLASDLSASGPVGRDAVRRVRSLMAAGAPVLVSGEVATLAVGADRVARLVREGGAWRVDALE